MSKSVVLPPPKWVLTPNRKMISGVVLYILVIFSSNFCLTYCCLPREKDIDDHVSMEIVGWPKLLIQIVPG